MSQCCRPEDECLKGCNADIPKVRWFTETRNVEPDAIEQVRRTASMPFVRGLAVMPDVHYGRGSTVGTVVVTKGAIMPACVGVDIGCGMIAVRTSLKPAQVRPHLRAIREGIERRIPLGIGLHGMNGRVLPSAESRVEALDLLATKQFKDVNHMNQHGKDWRLQLGSLGGGNHFIELCVGRPVAGWMPGTGPLVPNPETEDYADVWVILHSGSRGVGNRCATHWTQVAQRQAKKYMYDGWLPDPDLAYLVEHSEEFWQYMAELHWCQEFARHNRDEMMDRVLMELFHTVMGGTGINNPIEVDRINCHHNYVERERHDGENVLVTRKGAILATEGSRGLIPGSMGANSYVVTGLGDRGAFHSAPHGAGRRMSRTKARKQFTVEQVQAEMEARGVEARIREAIVDEAPGAYKSIVAVMDDARTLVSATDALQQIISVKGD